MLRRTLSFFLAVFGSCVISQPARVSAEESNAQQIARQAIVLPQKSLSLEASLSTKTATDTANVKWGTHAVKLKLKRTDDTQTIHFAFPDSDEPSISISMPINSKKSFTVQDESGKSITDLTRHVAESTFTYEDLTLQFLCWPEQEVTGKDSVKGRDALKLLSKPGKETNTAYSFVESWIDVEYKALMKAVAYNANHEIVKEFNIRSLQQLEDGTWMLKSLELRAPQEHARSELEILNAPNKKSR